MDRHVILTLGRSGSNTLVDLCNQHPALFNYGEVLGEWNTIRKMQRRLRFYAGSDARYLDALLSDRAVMRALNTGRTLNKMRKRDFSGFKTLRRIKSVGFKDFSLNFERYGLRSYLREREDIRVVGLQRYSLVDRLVSARVLKKTGVVANRGGAGDVPKLHLDPDTLVEDLEVFETESARLDEMLNELPPERVYRINYETLFCEPSVTQRIVGDVFEFLGVGHRDVKVRMKKIVKRGALDTIANLDECRSATSKTRFEDVFREGSHA